MRGGRTVAPPVLTRNSRITNRLPAAFEYARRLAPKTVKVTRLANCVDKSAEWLVHHSSNSWSAVSQAAYPTTHHDAGTALPGYIDNYRNDAMGRPFGTTYPISGAGAPQTVVDVVS